MTVTASQETESSTSQELPRHRRILQESGPAVGRISGISHLVLFTREMDEAVRFYRDLLGLRVVRTLCFTPSAEGLRSAAHHSSGSAVLASPKPANVATMKVRQVFFEMGNGELFSLYETPEVSKQPAASISAVLWPTIDPDRFSQPREQQKMDHLAFDVPTHADVVWFRGHLYSHGIAVSDVTERRGADDAHRFISSIYFYDPSGNPLEISSMNASDTEWLSYDFSNWFFDEDPVPSLVKDASDESPPLVPHWIRPSFE